MAVLGPSGAGKTTLLRIVAGLERPDAGCVSIGNTDVASVPAELRRAGLVFQGDALFPHMSVRSNLAFPLKMHRESRTSIARRVEEMARAFRLEAHLPKRPPELSGGERRRASLARALLGEPAVLLLDEPLTHLDPQARADVRAYLAIHRRLFAGPTILVTHDHADALGNADDLAIMIAGRIAQTGPPQHVFDFPATLEVARFLGSPPMNLLRTAMHILGIRPEHVRPARDGALRGRVSASQSIGSDSYVTLETDRGAVIARVPSESIPTIGTEIAFDFPERFVRRFDAGTGTLIA